MHKIARANQHCERQTEGSCSSQEAQVVAARNKRKGDMNDASPAPARPLVEVSRHPPQTGQIIVDVFDDLDLVLY